MTSDAVIVFVKAPVPGKVKTRLCPPLSFEQAAEIYRAFVKDTLDMTANISKAEVRIAYEPIPPLLDLSWLSGVDIPYFHQQGNDLGARLIHAFEQAFSSGAGKAVIIGSDSPGLPRDYLEKALNLLDSKDTVFGPAGDGGYYLAGLRRPCPGVFLGISWSRPEVFRKTVDLVCRNGLSMGKLPVFTDIDTFDELEKLNQKVKRRLLRDNMPYTAEALKIVFEPEVS